MFPIRDHNPSPRTPYVTYFLILANIAVFLFTAPLENDSVALWQIYRDYALIPAAITSGDGYLGIFSSTFLHGGLMHLAGNMLFLWIFGDNLEDSLGHFGFILFYLFSAIGAAAVQVYSDPVSIVPVIGASGAVAGVMGGYLLLFPKARVDVFFFFIVFFKIIPIPAWIVLGIWFALQLFNGATTLGAEGGVAYWAHVGGFVAGLLVVVPVWLRRGATNFWQQTLGQPPNPEAEYRIGRSRIPVIPRRKK